MILLGTNKWVKSGIERELEKEGYILITNVRRNSRPDLIASHGKKVSILSYPSVSLERAEGMYRERFNDVRIEEAFDYKGNPLSKEYAAIYIRTLTKV